MDPCSNWGYSNYTTHGLGCDRTSSGSGYAAQYPPALTKILDDLTTCGKTSPLFHLFPTFFPPFFSFSTFFLSLSLSKRQTIFHRK
jgi:alpha-glucuronidase